MPLTETRLGLEMNGSPSTRQQVRVHQVNGAMAIADTTVATNRNIQKTICYKSSINRNKDKPANLFCILVVFNATELRIEETNGKWSHAHIDFANASNVRNE
ncbi:hypothetical protein CDAR_174241 [Caerostris darwini]|uniref:Uncharacterized protein n=1 Tax=Caerostris darwini TaxID=1538125 RepID=A0AAV4VI73_9ARAC|nr:hypothetical protein CDAR_174241 [Caerostris darwini]